MTLTRLVLALSLASLVTADATRAQGARPDPVTTDPVVRDTAHRPEIVELHFTSGGARMNGQLYLAAGAGPHPTVVLLHGYPGNEQNLDLAQAVRRAGMNVLYFHYRGSWGSGGDFSFANAQADVAAALAYLRTPAIAAQYRVDPRRLALVGHSMGAWLALRGAAADTAIRCVAGIEFWDAGADGVRMRTDTVARADFTAYTADLTSEGGPLRSPAGAQALVASLSDNGEQWALAASAPALRARTVLLLDNTHNASHAPFVAALKAAGAARLTTMVWPTDHSFSDRRIALARAVVGWLRTGCGY